MRCLATRHNGDLGIRQQFEIGARPDQLLRAPHDAVILWKNGCWTGPNICSIVASESPLVMNLAMLQADAVAAGQRLRIPFRRGNRLRLPPHPLSPDPCDLAAVRRWVAEARSASQPTAIDLFSGAGGLSLGLIDAGFNVLLGADSDPVATETYAHNLSGLTYTGDLSDPGDLIDHLEGWGIRGIDLVAGGVPCQPFSLAGRAKIRSLVRSGQRSGTDARAHLWSSFLAAVAHLKPKAVLLENVPGLAEWEEGAILVSLCEGLAELGYSTDARILNASDFRVPQHRARLILVGLRNRSQFEWPAPHAWRSPTVRQAIDDLPEVDAGQIIERLPYDRPKSRLQERLRRDLLTGERAWIDDHITRRVREDDELAYRLMPEGGTYDELPAELRRYRSDIFSDKYKRLSWDDLSRSITAHIARDGYWYIHPAQHRTLSVREAARIQTFPDWFRFAGEPSHRYRQIGNAVPPLLSEAIGLRLREAMTRRGRRRLPTATSQREALMNWHRQHARSFPWRTGQQPWAVLMAEMCLHRTRAAQVVPVFGQLLALAPTPAAMVESAGKVLDVTHSLGLRWRAENIVAVARELVANRQGQVPDNRADLLSLPGVGDYVANAVLTFGFGRRAVVMDTNTSRIIGRLTGRSAPRLWQLRLDLYRLAGSEGADAAFNYALLDLGAMVCKASKPDCAACPLANACVTARSSSMSLG